MIPFWISVICWYLARQQAKRNTLLRHEVMLAVLDDLYKSLPLPGNKLEAWLISKVIMWIDEERNRILLLKRLHITEVGTIQN